MEDQKTQQKVAVSDLGGIVLASFRPNPSHDESSSDQVSVDPKEVGLDLPKTQVSEGSKALDLESAACAPQFTRFEVRDIQSDPELVGFWLQGKALRSIEAYTMELKRFLHFTGAARLSDLTVSQLMIYAESLKEELSVNSQALALGAVKSLLSFGVEVGYLEKNLGSFLKLPKRTDGRVRKVIDESKIQEMIFSETHLRNRLILRLLYSAGLRVSELCSLKWRDLQERGESGQIIVKGKGDKQRIILLSQGTWQEMQGFRNSALDASPVFQSQKGRGHLTRMQVRVIVKQAAKRMGMDAGISPHWMRHSHATHALERGASIILVKETLGHGSITTTQKYLHSRPEESSSQYLGI